jgi:transcriptional regulator with XRE-family HTH domain
MTKNKEAVALTIAQNLRKARHEKKMTQIELADVSGVSRVTIARIESNALVPDIITLLYLAKALHVDIEIFLKGINDIE